MNCKFASQWVEAALGAGMEPEIWIDSEGRRRLCCGIVAHGGPPLLTDPQERRAVANELIRRNRVTSVAAARPRGQVIAGASGLIGGS